jgi:hypothetical protein
MKQIYLVDYWVPFPSSEYGGIINVIAENDNECHDLLVDFAGFDKAYDDRIMANVAKAPRFELVNQEEESRIVDAFLT